MRLFFYVAPPVGNLRFAPPQPAQVKCFRML